MIEQLELRIQPAIASFTTVSVPELVLSIQASDYVIASSSGSILFASPIATTDEIRIDTTAISGATLTVDISNGLPIPTGGLSFAAGTGSGDGLELTGGSVDSVTYDHAGPHDGTISITTPTGTRSLSYSGLDPIVDSLVATSRSIHFSGADDSISVEDSSTAGFMFVDSDFAESIAFAIPTSTLTIDGGAGSDSFQISGVDPLLAADLILTGGDAIDDATIAASLSFPGSLSITAEAIVIEAPLVTTTGDQSYFGPVGLGGSTHLTGDHITFNDTVDATFGPTGALTTVSFSGGVLSDRDNNSALDDTYVEDGYRFQTEFSANTLGTTVSNPRLRWRNEGIGIPTPPNRVIVDKFGSPFALRSLFVHPSSQGLPITVTADNGSQFTLTSADRNTTVLAPPGFTGITSFVMTASGTNQDTTLDDFVFAEVPEVNLTTTATSVASFTSEIGSVFALRSLQTGGAGHTVLGGDVFVEGDNTVFNTPVLLADDVTITQDGTGDVQFLSSVDGTAGGLHQLAVLTQAGQTRFGGPVGSDALGVLSNDSGLGGLTTNTAGTTRFVSGPVIVDGSITINDPAIVDTNITYQYSGTAALRDVSGTGGISADGPGLMQLAGSSTYGGDLNVTSGTLRLTGSTASDIFVSGNGILSGSGTTTGNVSVTNGRVAPGTSPGILTVNDLTLTAASDVDIELGGTTPGTEHDQIVVTGNVSLGDATLNTFAINSYVALIGSTHVIIRNDGPNPVTGTFAGLADGDQLYVGFQAFRIDYDGGDGNDVVLTAEVPVVQDVYVDDDWTGLLLGTDPDGAGPANAIGLDAFATIQQGVDAVAVDGTVHVYPGSYLEAVTISHDLVLTGESGVRGDVVIDPPGTGSNGISVTSAVADISIRNLTATSAATGIHSLASGAVVLINVDASNNISDGIFVSNASSVAISNSQTNNNDFDHDNSGSGIEARNVGTVTLAGVESDANVQGVLVTTATSFADTDSRFTNNLDGGVVVQDITGNVSLTRTVTRDNDADFDNIGAGLAANRVLNTSAIGGNASLFGIQATATVAGHQRDGVSLDGVGGLVRIEDAAGPAASTLIDGNDDDGVSITSIGGTLSVSNATITNNDNNDGVGVGLFANAVGLVMVTNSRVNGNDASGMVINSSTGVTISGSEFNNNGNDGLRLQNAATANISGSTFSGNGGDGVEFGETGGPVGVISITSSSGASNTGLGLNVTRSATTNLQSGTWSGISILDTTTARITTTPVVSTKDVRIETRDETLISTTVDLVGNNAFIHAGRDGAGTLGFRMTASGSLLTTSQASDAIVINVNTLAGGTANAAISRIETGTTTGGVRIAAAQGAITDVNASALNIVSATALLTGGAGVGTGNALETRVGNVEGAGGTGGFHLVEQDSITIGLVDLLTTGITTSTGSVNIVAAGTITVAENITAGGAVNLDATDAASPGQDVVVKTFVTVSSSTADVTVQAGDNITLEDSSTLRVIQNDDTVRLFSDVGNADPGIGTTVLIEGSIEVPGSPLPAEVTGGPDGDRIVVAPGALHTVGRILLNGATGNDQYEVVFGRLTGGVNAVTIDDIGGGIDSAVLIGSTADESFAITNNAADGSPQTGGAVANITAGETVRYTTSLEALTVEAGDGQDTFTAQPSQTTEITVSGGDPVFGDPGVPPGDTLQFQPLGNAFAVSGNSLLAGGGSPGPFQNVNFISIENMPVVPQGTSPVTAFDFDHSNTGSTVAISPTQSGYTSVLRGTVYSAAPGYGWQDPGATGQPVNSFERNDGFYIGPFADLIRDGHTFDSPSTFTANLANGWYSVDVTLGNPYTSVSGVSIKDGDSGSLIASGITTVPGESTQATFAVLVNDGTLDLNFIPAGVHPQIFSVNGLVIRPANLLTMGLDVSGVGVLPADGVTTDTFTLIGAPPNSLITVDSTLATIVSQDVSPEIAGIQVLSNPAGEATIQVLRPTGAGTAAFNFVAVNGLGIGFSSLQYALPDVRNFDFNHPNLTSAVGSSPTQSPVATPFSTDGFVGVLPTATYNGTRGFGWLTSPGSFDDGSLNVINASNQVIGIGELTDLARDGARDTIARTFRVDLPDGDYQGLATIGDVLEHDGLTLTVNGVTAYSGIATSAGQHVQIPFEFTVGGGVAEFEFSDGIGTALWTVNGLQIRPVATVSPFVFTPAIGDVPADGLTQVTITATTTLADGELVTVDSSIGTIVTADENSAIAGVQVKVVGGRITFDIVAPGTPGVPAITATSLDGLHHSSIADPTFLNFTLSSIRRFDFNHTNTPGSAAPSPTAAGFIGVLRTDTDPSDGHGWVTAPNSDDTGVPNAGDNCDYNSFIVLTTDLYRDSHFGHSSLGARIFQVQVDSTETYNGHVYVGSQRLDASTQVLVEGVAVPLTADTLAREFAVLPYSGARDVNNDGVIDFVFSSAGGISPFWSVLGLDIVDSGSLIPLPAPVVGLERGNGYSIDPLTRSDLQPIVEIAIAAWEYSGLSPAELNRLRNTQIVIRDLGSNGALGLTTAIGQIVLDDNGAGLGWSLVRDKVTGDRYDLLTVVAHEFGHILGRPDLNPLTHSSELMSSFLGRGERHDDLNGSDGFFDQAVYDAMNSM